ncbi:Exodeoxyribonuclease VII large subunit [Ligilactobacillus sp. WC1T17]|uniref:Exodeoxyribonuclease 7 large subunit n=1 Tax=Ligilactobacillus ruminis TaxID=1623 RepID=A0ABY1A9I9_9LACO|nr:Exodeoxyribonuclease VII large subunit [Ligilactobacillus ruminis]
MTENNYLTVTALTKYLKRKFTADPYLKKVWLVGEISNFRLRRGHQYFSLKDEKAVINAVMFASNFNKIKFTPESGMKVIVSGRIDIYEASGNYQFYIETMEPEGVGALYQALEELKAKLAKEGLFSGPKRKITPFPRRIAVITSRSGAVIRDIITTVTRRYPIAQLVLFPAEVQGERAADALVGRLKEVNERGDFDTIIIGRGGGSIEDLWPFNEEKVVRAIYASQIPIISSVGHETDTTLADLAADVRAATPTAAAELATSVLSEDLVKIDQLKNRLLQAMQARLAYLKQRLQKNRNSYIFATPERLYDSYVQKLDQLNYQLQVNFNRRLKDRQNRLQLLQQHLYSRTLSDRLKLLESDVKQQDYRLEKAGRYLLEQKKEQLAKAANALDMLSPLKVMGRGFSYVTKEEQVVKQVSQLEVGTAVDLHLRDGQAKATITQIIEEEK